MAETEANKVLNLYPIDYPFETLKQRVKDKKLNLSPEFQRKFKWDKEGHERGSKFIESCLMRIPLPACYFAERADSTHDVIDGVQRITTITNFFDDKFTLEGLTVFKELNGKKFSELGELKNELESTTIRCIVLRKDNARSVVNEIFSRLNQGAVKLEPQEIRHAVYPGSLDTLLSELAKKPTIKSFKSKRDKDSLESEEMILRYFAFNSDSDDRELSGYEGKLAKYLDEHMAKNQNLSPLEIQLLKEDFENTLANCLKVFDQDNLFKDVTADLYMACYITTC